MTLAGSPGPGWVGPGAGLCTLACSGGPLVDMGRLLAGPLLRIATIWLLILKLVGGAECGRDLGRVPSSQPFPPQ